MYGMDREQIERVDEYLKESPAVAEVVPSYAMLVSIEAQRNPKLCRQPMTAHAHPPPDKPRPTA